MEFSAIELRFLGQARDGMTLLDRRAWASMPAHIRQRVAEHRAHLLGEEFTEFRQMVRAGAAASLIAASPSPDLNPADLF